MAYTKTFFIFCVFYFYDKAMKSHKFISPSVSQFHLYSIYSLVTKVKLSKHEMRGSFSNITLVLNINLTFEKFLLINIEGIVMKQFCIKYNIKLDW